MARGISIQASVTGPFFDHGHTATPEAINAWVEDTVHEGEAKLGAQLYQGHGVATGEYKRNIHGVITQSMHGKIVGGSDFRSVIVGAWLEGVSKRNERSRFKGYHAWRATRTHLRRIANELAGKVYARITKRLT